MLAMIKYSETGGPWPSLHGGVKMVGTGYIWSGARMLATSLISSLLSIAASIRSLAPLC
jgi:hypothetical protein